MSQTGVVYYGDVPAPAREVAEYGVTTGASEFFRHWQARECSARPCTDAWAYAERAHARDRVPRCVLPSSIGYVVYALAEGAPCR